jgi:hypothetical protein
LSRDKVIYLAPFLFGCQVMTWSQVADSTANPPLPTVEYFRVSTECAPARSGMARDGGQG